MVIHNGAYRYRRGDGRAPLRVSDTERGPEIRAEINLLERLVEAYRRNELRER